MKMIKFEFKIPKVRKGSLLKPGFKKPSLKLSTKGLGKKPLSAGRVQLVRGGIGAGHEPIKPKAFREKGMSTDHHNIKPARPGDPRTPVQYGAAGFARAKKTIFKAKKSTHKNIEKADIIKAFIAENGNKTAAGAWVGVSRHAVSYYLDKISQMNEDELASLARKLNTEVGKNPDNKLNKAFREKHNGKITVNDIKELCGIEEEPAEAKGAVVNEEARVTVKALLLSNNNKSIAGALLNVDNEEVFNGLLAKILAMKEEELQGIASAISREWQEPVTVEHIRKSCRTSAEEKASSLGELGESSASEWLLTGRKYQRRELMLSEEEQKLLTRVIGDNNELSWGEILQKLIKYAKDSGQVKYGPKEKVEPSGDSTPLQKVIVEGHEKPVWAISKPQAKTINVQNLVRLQLPEPIAKLMAKITRICQELNINIAKLKIESKGGKIFAVEKKPVNQKILDYFADNPEKTAELSKMNTAKQLETIAAEIGESADAVKNGINELKLIFREFGEDCLANISKEYQLYRDTGKLPQKWLNLKDIVPEDIAKIKILKYLADISEAELTELDLIKTIGGLVDVLAKDMGENPKNISSSLSYLMKETRAKGASQLADLAKKLINGEKIDMGPVRLFDVVGRESIGLKILKYLADAPEEVIKELNQLTHAEFAVKFKEIMEEKDVAEGSIIGGLRELKSLTGTFTIEDLAKQAQKLIYEGKAGRAPFKLSGIITKKETSTHKFLMYLAGLSENDIAALKKLKPQKLLEELSAKTGVNEATLRGSLDDFMKISGADNIEEIALIAVRALKDEEIERRDLNLFEVLNTENSCIGKVAKYLATLSPAETEVIKKMKPNAFHRKLSRMLNENFVTVGVQILMLQRRTAAKDVVELIQDLKTVMSGGEISGRKINLFDIAKAEELHFRVLKYLDELPEEELVKFKDMSQTDAARIIAQEINYKLAESVGGSIGHLKRMFREKDIVEIIRKYRELKEKGKILGQNLDKMFPTTA